MGEIKKTEKLCRIGDKEFVFRTLSFNLEKEETSNEELFEFLGVDII